MRGTVVRTAALRPLFGWKVILRQVLPPALAISLILIFWQRFHELDLAQVSRTFALISPLEWAVAGAFTLISFCAVGHYDRFWHGYFGTGLGRGHAWRTGMASVAVAQTTGLGLLVGAMMRWRLQSGGRAGPGDPDHPGCGAVVSAGAWAAFGIGRVGFSVAGF